MSGLVKWNIWALLLSSQVNSAGYTAVNDAVSSKILAAVDVRLRK